MTTGAREPYSNPAQTGYLDRVAVAVFGRLGHRVEVRPVPPARSINEAIHGRSDGDMQRIAGLVKRYPTLIRVPERVNVYHFAGFALKPDIRFETWQQLDEIRPGHMLGWKYYEAKVPQSARPVKVAAPDQLFRLLKAGRMDVALFSLYGGNWWARQLKVKTWPVKGPFDSLDMYMYLHIKNQALADPLARSLAALKKEGVIETIRQQTLPGYEKLRTN